MISRLLSVSLACMLLLAVVGFGPIPTLGSHDPDDLVTPEVDPAASHVFLPVLYQDYLPATYRLCRFGVGGGGLAGYKVNQLRIGWYLNWTATPNVARPGGIDYMPMVRLSQTGLSSYNYYPAQATILSEVAAHPGTTWIIGNEPDCIWQDDLEPHVYAKAYHELYYLIKTADPTARIAAGSIVQPTPLRLQYLDMVLDAYQTEYGELLPADIWNTHAFILREEAGSWGAGIPPGIDVTQGELYEIDDNDNIVIFRESLRTFRLWMKDNGYQDSALIITEFGVQMWPDYISLERVNAFMDATFDFLLSATDPNTGYPEDDYRLVQQWAWYSVSDDNYNGWLFDPDTRQITVHGQNFAAYTDGVAATANLRPVTLTATSGLTTTLNVKVVNDGNIEVVGGWQVDVYDGNPAEGGVLLSSQIARSLDGCGAAAVLEVAWPGAAPGSHTLTVVVDPANAVCELDEQDNTLVVVIDL